MGVEERTMMQEIKAWAAMNKGAKVHYVLLGALDLVVVDVKTLCGTKISNGRIHETSDEVDCEKCMRIKEGGA